MGKNIVICFDGTGNEIEYPLTNVGKVLKLSIYDSNKQTLFYEQGVGTKTILKDTALSLIKETLSKAFGWGIAQNIVKAYLYLMDEYEAGDKIYIFGFSRGAYTARALLSVLFKVGLLYRGNAHLLSSVASAYLRNNPDELRLLKDTITSECTPYFLGVWDTVDSRGQVDKNKYPLDIDLHPNVCYAYQALSIDEKRAKFRPVLLTVPPKFGTNVMEQVWFSGVHSDIGGGSHTAELSDISLKWMLYKASDKGLLLKEGWESTLNPNALGPIDESYIGWWKFWEPKYREIPDDANIHISVVERIQNVNGYKPRLPNRYDIVTA